MKLENIIILQNKVDLIREDAALAQHQDITAFVKGRLGFCLLPSHYAKI
jgi:translation initiation factor 2 subunit 3